MAAPVRTIVAVGAFAIAVTGTAAAQMRPSCVTPEPPAVGIAIGRSLPYLELNANATGSDPTDTLSVESGFQLVARAEAPLVGPLRGRLEIASASWDVRRRRYDEADGFRLIDDVSVDRMTTSHVVGLVGIGLGRAPVCARVAVGGGFYSIGTSPDPVRRPGVALNAGIDIPAGDRHAIQIDATLHMIATSDAPPIAMSTVPALSLTVGLTRRF